MAGLSVKEQVFYVGMAKASISSSTLQPGYKHLPRIKNEWVANRGLARL